MSKFTKKALVDSFLKVCAEKPIEKITVRDIVDDCGLNRNTFYYYFADIYALVEELLTEVTEEAVLCSRESGTLHAGCNAIVLFIRLHRDAFRNIYSAMGRDSVEYAISKVLDPAMLHHVRRRAEELNVSLHDADAQLIIDVYRNVFFGALADWMKRGFRNDPSESFARVELLFEDSLDSAIQNAGKLPPVKTEA